MSAMTTWLGDFAEGHAIGYYSDKKSVPLSNSSWKCHLWRTLRVSICTEGFTDRDICKACNLNSLLTTIHGLHNQKMIKVYIIDLLCAITYSIVLSFKNSTEASYIICLLP